METSVFHYLCPVIELKSSGLAAGTLPAEATLYALVFNVNYFSVCIFETGSHIVQTGLGFAVLVKMTLNPWSSCPYFPSARAPGVCPQAMRYGKPLATRIKPTLLGKALSPDLRDEGLDTVGVTGRHFKHLWRDNLV